MKDKKLQFKKDFWKYLQLPKRKVNEDEPFYFYLYDWRNNGLIFLVTALLIPFVTLFILRFGLGMNTSNPVIDQNWLITINLVVTLISAAVGWYILQSRDKDLFVHSGLFVFYAFIVIPNIVSFIISIVVGLAGVKSGDPAMNMISLWTQILSELIVLYLAFRFTNDLKSRILQTFKENWLMLIITTIIVAGLMYAVTGPIYEAIFKGTDLSLSTSSDNQTSLESGFSDTNGMGYRVAYAISLFILTICIAPLTEEIATRNAWFVGTGNKTIAIITSAMYFGMLHSSSGDVEHMLNYAIGGLFLAGTFAISRGNVTYDACAHAAYNLISYSILINHYF